MSSKRLDGSRLKNIIWRLKDWLGPDYIDKIASETGASVQTVVEWEKGLGKVTDNHLLRLSDLFQKQSHSASGNNPSNWMRKGQQLLKASEVLKKVVDEEWECAKKLLHGGRPTFPPDVVDQMHMLRSFALECLFKALILRKGGMSFCEGDQISYGDGHPLVDLAKNASIALTKPEGDIVRRLEAYVYLGRYPLLKKYKHDSLSARLDREAKCHWSFDKEEIPFANVLRKIEVAWQTS
jgi:hypothetical protein